MIFICSRFCSPEGVNFELADNLKTTIVSSIVKFLSFHNFKIFWILTTQFKKNLLFKPFIIRKVNTKNLLNLLNRYIPFHSQSTIWSPFLTSMPAISHFVWLILRPQTRENLSNVLITSVTDFSFLN